MKLYQTFLSPFPTRVRLLLYEVLHDSMGRSRRKRRES